jgi:hypothetical protein
VKGSVAAPASTSAWQFAHSNAQRGAAGQRDALALLALRALGVRHRALDREVAAVAELLAPGHE